ncbi:hypothetical protein GYMLUDRAFT_249277 [Collybiopsis luxurians FD-317 M1]|uniref:DUF6533 domain-containing protein n=1 Tax=Collybiopsis luxurians FD-317 M1 TaxID=944289 RepID=A0A0D0CIE1_9AGAR|nr:hypothetical protein GYMLUDRAFT_249277 [Collybiopsis luxurians FD-317 M1]
MFVGLASGTSSSRSWAAFLCWDHLLTLSDEVQFLWGRPLNVTLVMFFFNRYFAVLGDIIVAVSLFSNHFTESRYSMFRFNRPKTDDYVSCERFHTFRELMLVVTQVIVCSLLTIRIYALYHKSKRILTVMLSAGCILGGLSVFSIFFGRSSQSEETSSGCHTGLTFITSVQVAAAWEALFLYDSMLFGITLHRAYKTRHELRVIRQIRVPLIIIILRDGKDLYSPSPYVVGLNKESFHILDLIGSVYFGVMAFANAAPPHPSKDQYLKFLLSFRQSYIALAHIRF